MSKEAEEFLRSYYKPMHEVIVSGRNLGKTSKILTEFAEAYFKHRVESISDEDMIDSANSFDIFKDHKLSHLKGQECFKNKLLNK